MFESIILIILALIVFIIVYKIISKVIKAMIIALLIFVFLVASLGLIFYEDVKDLKDSTEERLILLEHDNEILTALEVKKLEKAGNYAFENIEDISLIKQKYGEHKWDDLTKEHGRMFVLDDRYFEGLPQQVDLSEISIQMERDSLLDVLVAPDPIEHYIDLAYSSETEEELDMVKQELMGEFKTSEDFRAAIFILSTIEITEEKGLSYAYDQYMVGNLQVHPKTIVFALTSILPRIVVKIILWFV